MNIFADYKIKYDMNKNFTIMLAVILIAVGCQSSKKQIGEEVNMMGKTINTVGMLPKVGSKAQTFTVTSVGMEDKRLEDFKGKNIILNVFPSVDTRTCSASVRHFNELAASLDNTVVLCISKDLPFALSRFCGAEGIENVETLSDFRGNFGDRYGLTLANGRMKGLLARAVIVIDKNNNIIYKELVKNISNEPGL